MSEEQINSELSPHYEHVGDRSQAEPPKEPTTENETYSSEHVAEDVSHDGQGLLDIIKTDPLIVLIGAAAIGFGVGWLFNRSVGKVRESLPGYARKRA